MAIGYGATFPRYLSSPPQVLWWEMDELVLIVVFFGLATTIGGWQYVVGLFGAPYLFRKTKNKAENGYFKRILYVVGAGHLDGYPTHFEKKFQE